MSSKRKLIVWGSVLGVSTIVGLWVYRQVDVFMKNLIGFKTIKFLQVTNSGVLKFDIWLTYTNKTNVSAVLTSQVYKVYANGKFVGEAENFAKTPIKANGESIIGVQVDVPVQNMIDSAKKYSVQQLAFKALEFIEKGPRSTTIKIDMELKMKVFGFIPITVPYSYVDRLSNMY